MNDRIEKLVKQAGIHFHNGGTLDAGPNGIAKFVMYSDMEKFAELIVKECANTIENRAPGQMGKEGEGWTNGYDDGLKTGAFLIKEHFGVEE